MPAPVRPWKNVAVRLGTEGSARVLNFLLAVLGARYLGVEGWGLYWSAFSFAQVLSLLTDLGGHLTLSRSVTRLPARARHAMGTSLALKLILSSICLILWALAGGFPGIPIALQAVLVGSALLISFVEWLGFHLRGFGRVPGESVLLAIDCIGAFILGFISLLIGTSPLGFAVTQVVAHGLVLAGSCLVLGKESNFRPLLPQAGLVWKFLRESLPTGLAQASTMGSWRLGIMFLAVSPGAGPVVAGLYAAAHRILEAARFLPAAAAAALFPSFSQKTPGARPIRAVIYLLPLAVLSAIIMNSHHVSSLLNHLLYGKEYANAAVLLGIIWWAFPFMTINWIVSHWLVARGRTGWNAGISVVQLSVHAGFLFLLVPSMGIIGAGWSLVISEGFYSAASLLVLSIKR